MVTSPTNDFVIRIKNAAKARKTQITVPYSKAKEAIAKVMVKEGYLASAKKNGNNFVCEIAYIANEPRLVDARNVSTPSLHVYKKAKEIKNNKKRFVTWIVSTPAGVMSGREAGKKGLGGEVIAEVW
ncbi:30S ribosomal protein S8 [Candidatus Microgenomates bacterium]|nr:30S ribosomal protein S8 [Candidatus Microgenomates bacterium]